MEKQIVSIFASYNWCKPGGNIERSAIKVEQRLWVKTTCLLY